MNPTSNAALPVTVLMPVFNGERYLRSAVESVLAQTYTDFEFLILDDGSTDATPRILAEYAARDRRVRVCRHENMDQPATLNRGLRLARHDWVAIMDHDDICLPRRLERQIELMRQQPEARVIGSWAIEINSAGKPMRIRTTGPTTVADFRLAHDAAQRVPLVHASVLMHRPTIVELGGYDPAFGPSADTELWSRVAHRHPIVVVPEPLMLYRIHSQSMSFRRLFEQRAMLRWIIERDQARRRSAPLPTFEEFQASRRVQRWLDLQHDVFWYFRSNCLLAASEGARLPAAAFAVCAAAASPANAIRLVRRHLRERLPAAS